MELNITPINKEVTWDKNLELVSKTDKFGNIQYCNEAFVNVSGYEDFELVGKAHNIIRHPEMPKVIFKLLWDNLKKGTDFHAVIKNMAKTGRYYWVITQFEIQKNEDGEIINYIGRRKAVNQNTISTFEALYIKLKQIEDAVSVEASEDYLIGFLDDKKMSYAEFLENTLLKDTNNQITYSQNTATESKTETKKGKRSFFSVLFG